MDCKRYRFTLALGMLLIWLNTQGRALNLATMMEVRGYDDSEASEVSVGERTKAQSDDNNSTSAMAAEAGATPGIWINATEIATLPTSGTAWQKLKTEADKLAGAPKLSNQDDPVNVRIMAKALVFARTKNERYRTEVINACMAAIGTEKGGRTLALGRELVAYVIAADLVGLPPKEDQRFRTWLRETLTEKLDGSTLRSTHEQRPNNWGTHAGASRVAVAVYLGDQAEIARCVQVFKGWLGDRVSYAGFKYSELYWQANPSKPVGINPKGAMKNGYSIDGVLPDDQRRCGSFRWPPPKENYVYEALQGALVQAVILYRLGYDVWNWQDKALLRAFEWLHNQAKYPASGDDNWQPHLINYYYRTKFPAPVPSTPGKNVGWTDWTHSSASGGLPRAEAPQDEAVPESFTLEQNYPNPFVSEMSATQIAFAVEEAGWVSLDLYNTVGQKIRTLFTGLVQPGRHVFTWNGRDSNGARLPSGVYIYKLTAGSVSTAKRLILSK
ncbi:MAG: alginate lyase family protein [bacterium]